MNSLLESLQQT